MLHECIFASDDQTFGVYRFEPDGSSRVITISGKLGHLDQGEHLSLEGDWVEHPRFGRQFKVDSFKLELPDREEGLVQLLGSGAVQGFGPVFAKRLVDHFGKETAYILDEAPERLKEVKGLGKKKQQALLEYWKGRESTRKVMLSLSEAGIGYKQALKLQMAYGENAHRVLTHQPYALMNQIKGFGFQTVDRLAMRMGFETDALERRRGGLSHVLNRAEDDGHCYLPKQKLIDQTAELLQLSNAEIEVALNDALLDKHLVWIQDVIMKPEFHALEKEVTESMQLCLKRPLFVPWDTKALKKVIEEEGFELALSQEGALETILTHAFSILTGGPGVGKTTLVKILVKYFEQYGFEPVLAAPTGRASQRMEETTGRSAMTMHRLLKVKGETREFVHGPEHPLQGKVFIIDEFSMVDVRLFHAFLIALPKSCQIILVGDKDQLPSVGPGRVLADLMESGKVPFAKLSEVFRQSQNSLLVENSHRIIAGQMPKSPTQKALQDFYFIPSDSVEQTLGIIHRLINERIPERFGGEYVKSTQVLTPMKKGPLGTEQLNQQLQSWMNPSGQSFLGSDFKIGDKVIQLTNNYDVELFNGDMGTVIEAGTHDLKVRFSDKEVHYPIDTLSDLALAYACTVHKSQGSEYPIVIMPIYEGHRLMLSLELMYTALTRARKLCVWIGSPEFLENLIQNPRRIERHTFLKDRLAQLP